MQANWAGRARAPRPHEPPPRPASCIIGNLAAGCHGDDGGAVDLTQGARGNVHAPCVDDDDFPSSRGSISGPPLTCSAPNSCLE